MPTNYVKDVTAAATPARTELSLSGLTCGNCARRVTDALQAVPGVTNVAVTLDPPRGTVWWRAGETPQPDRLVAAVANAGYRAMTVASPRPQTVSRLEVPGMNCNNCVRHVTEALHEVEGVAGVTTDLETRRATVRWMADVAPRAEPLVAALQRAGYEAHPVVSREGPQGDAGARRVAGWHLTLWIGVAGTVPLMLGEWVFGLGHEPWFRWFAFGLATVVQVIAGAPFYRGAWNQLKVGSSSMDTLVALGSTTAYVYSAGALLFGVPGHLYFMEAAAIITIISIGHWLEARVSARASSALRALLDLAPVTARRRAPDGTETEVPVAELQPGDRLSLRPGDRVPTDGEVVQGEAAVDESMLTGESVPVDKARGSQVYAGTVNLNGRLVMGVTAVGEATALAHIIEAVQRAQHSRANIQRLADRVSNIFVPVVVLIALATALWWGLANESARAVHAALEGYLWSAPLPTTALAAAMIGAAAVLIIACPCAMGLATPAAIMAGSNVAARRGILVRDGVALEKAGNVTAVIFDKTGTLTVGRPEVAAFRLAGHPDAENLEASAAEAVAAAHNEPAVRLAAALARHSSHPLSQAIARLAPEDLPVRDWQEHRGAGVQASVRRIDHGDPATHAGGAEENLVRLGSLRWLTECGVQLALVQEFVGRWTGQGATVLGLAADQQLLAAIAVKDTVKPGAHAVVQRLQAQGLKTFMVTGDNRLTAAGIAQHIGIPTDNVFAEVRPEQKAEFVKRLQQRGERVAFVGDGINDAPALEQAELGIAVARASDIAREAADIILLKSEIEAVPESLGLARATLRTIRQNLFWAFFYNAVGVPLAALGFMSPVLCALAMGLSDLVVIGNALRLRGWKG